eukprot:TRINITY_DN20879_c0_g1_i2.p1 TRINITY_DN20879_c0_g1~~TRINITY_DN20879_c0_g1_i2.p1  ORF type:complete len:117 (+),score=6.16 TRINITY_DN20879_c0_g1_i2:400-750(+)
MNLAHLPCQASLEHQSIVRISFFNERKPQGVNISQGLPNFTSQSDSSQSCSSAHIRMQMNLIHMRSRTIVQMIDTLESNNFDTREVAKSIFYASQLLLVQRKSDKSFFASRDKLTQ